MSGNEVKIRIDLEKPRVDDELKETADELKRMADEARKAGGAAKPAIDSIGVSAKQTAAALRGVPAQFTDIVTALQGGQAPLTVLLQQGGQLKDMFGGIGPAARALGGYIFGLINPVTIAAGAIGALALAYSKGAEEQENFTRTLILSGNIAGTTAGQLADSARNIAETTGATQSNAAEVLNSLVASGKVATDILEDVSQAAVDLERNGGVAVAQTAKEFESLGDKPVDAVLKLNEKYHFLTSAVFDQIKALADQGKETDAARVAQLAYADAIEGRIPKLKENIGLLETAWRGVADAGKSAWDWMLGIGREGTLEDKLAEAKRYAEFLARSGDSDTAAGKRSNAEAQKAIAAIEAQIAAEKKLATATGESVKAEESRVKATVAWASEEIKYLDKQAQKAAEILRVKNLMTAAGKDEAYQARVLAEIEKKYAEKKAAATPQENKYKQLSEEMDKYLAQLNAEIEGEQKLTKGQSIAAEVRRTLTKAQQDARAPSLALIDAAEQTLELRREQTKAEEAAYKETQRRAADLANSVAATEKETESIRAHTAELGLSAEQIDLVRAARVDDLIALQEHELAELDAAGTCTAYSVALRENVEALKLRRSALQEQSSRQAEVDAEKKIADERKRGWEETDRIARDVFTSIADDGSSAMETIGKALEKALLSAAYEATLQPLVFQAYTSFAGALGADGATGAGGVAGSLSSAGNLVSAGNSAFNLVGGGAGGLYTDFALSGLGSTLGLSSTMGGVGGMAGVMGSSGASITSLGSAVGSAIPYVGLALAAVSLLGDLFGKKGGPKTEGEFLGHIGANGEIAQESTRYGSKGSSQALANAAPALAKLITTTVESLGGNAQGLGLKYWSSVDPAGTAGDMGYGKVYDAAGTISYSHAWTVDRGDYAEELAIEFQRMTLAAIRATDVPVIFKEVVAGIELTKASADELSATLAQVQGVAQIRSAFDLVDLGAERLSLSLIDVAGGVDALGQNLSSYYSTYFAESERLYNTLRQVSATFAELGETVPESVGEFRGRVEGLDLATSAGQSAFASLMAVQQAFASVTSAVDGLKAGVADATYDLRSAQEQAAIEQQALADAAAAAGVAVPTSVAELLRLADHIDYTTEAGLQLAAAMPKLAAAFSTAGAEATSAAALLENAFTFARAAVDTAYDALSRSVDAEKKRLDAAYAAQAASLSDAADAARTVRDNISALSDRLTRAVNSTTVDTVEFAAQRRIAAQQSLDTALAAAQSGQSLAPFSASIDAAIGDLAQPSENLYETFVDYARAQGRAAGTLAQLDTQAKAQKSVADLTLEAINASIRAAEVQHTQDIAALDRTLENAQAQLDALNGIDDSVLSVASAISALAAAINASKALDAAKNSPDTVTRIGDQRAMLSSNGALLVGDTLNATNGYTGSVTDATSIITDVFGSTAPADFQAAAKAVGLSAAMIDELYGFAPGTSNLWAQANGLKGFARGGVASAGMYVAGEHGPELIESATATRIYPAEQTSALMNRLNSPADNASELLREIRELRKVVERQAEQLASIQASTGQTAEILDSNTGGGGPSLVRMV